MEAWNYRFHDAACGLVLEVIHGPKASRAGNWKPLAQSFPCPEPSFHYHSRPDSYESSDATVITASMLTV